MLSYLQSSSSAAVAPPLSNAQLIQTHLPFTPSLMNDMLQPLGKGKRKKQGKANSIVSKAYNIVASRPIAHPKFRENIITVNMRYTSAAFLSSSTISAVYSGTSFVISSFSDYAQYLGLFDQYKIDMIEAWLEPVVSQSTISSNTGELYSAVDLDDANPPTSLTSVEGKQTSLVTNGLDGHYHKWIPHVAVATYSGAFNSYGNVSSTWIDSGSPNVQHYGLKVGITPTAANTVYSLTVRAVVSFKQPGL
jgi:hypothetical protein